MDMLEIDGKSGGGQLLRSALSLSLCTGTGFIMHNIRSARPRPGLLRQHLTSVQAACAISSARAEGATLGSTQLHFAPGEVTPGDYRFAVGTAGSTMLVLQTLLPAFWRSHSDSYVRLEGGTHNPLAPSADFVAGAYLPALQRMGVCASVELDTHGFYPAGGGVVSATVQPCHVMKVAKFRDRGELVSVEATALMSALSSSIGRRELQVMARRLGLEEEQLNLHSVRPAVGPGNTLTVRVQYEHHSEIFTGHGERRVSAENVAERLATQVQRYLDSGACVSEHLSDQLLLPMALAGGGEFTTCTASDHLRTNAALIEKFIAVDIDYEAVGADCWHVSVST